MGANPDQRTAAATWPLRFGEAPDSAWRKRGVGPGLNDIREFLVELISQLFHADVLITEQAERIEALEAETARLRAALAEASGRAA